MDVERWRDPEWLARAEAWIGAELARAGLERTGKVEQPHVYPWATVLRVPTDSGPLWFKANDQSLQHEAAVVALLAQRRPDCVPPLVAADAGRGWMLMRDAGERLRGLVEQERSLDRWLEVLPLYAGLQLDVADAADELLAAGLPDLRLATLPERYERLLDEVGAEERFRAETGRVERLCAELAAFGIPETVQHDDLHDGQVFLRDGRYLLLDWGDACLSHPFFTLAVTLGGVLSFGLDDVAGSVDTTPFRDAYLAPYRERFDGDLDSAADIALRLGWVCRAVNGYVPGEDASTLTRLRMFLDGHP